MSKKRRPNISRLSARSLMAAVYNKHSPNALGTVSGFMVNSKIGPCFVTARHCLTGRDHFSGKLRANGAIPSEIRIYQRPFSADNSLPNMTLIFSEELYDASDNPRWYEHYQFADFCDFAILPIKNDPTCRYYYVNTTPNTIELSNTANNIKTVDGFVVEEGFEIGISVGDRVNIIGYPFGTFTGSGLPLWTGGYISCEPEMVGQADCIFVDCRARQGQSGSPVYFVGNGQIPLRNGEGAFIDGRAFSFLGIYVGRINKESDLGMVWPAEAISSTISRLDQLNTAAIPEERPTKFGGPLSRIGLPASST